MKFVLYIVVVCIFLHIVFAQETFNYDNVKDWPTEFAQSCAGMRQSPINIDAEKAEYKEFGQLVFTGYDETEGDTQTLVNNGHTLELMLSGNYAISGGGLAATYNAAQLHFHWGSVSTQGSEHTVDSRKYSAEMHIVHVKDGMTPTEALSDPSGYAVLAFFVEVADEDNAEFEPLIEAMKDIVVEEEGGEVLNRSIVLQNILPDDTTNFYRYDGSLTTPHCNEAVVWTVFQSTIPLSESQLAVFREFRDVHGHAISNNFRPTQPLNGRTVYTTTTTSGGNIFAVSLIAMILSVIMHVSL